jgi:hypothetical protein
MTMLIDSVLHAPAGLNILLIPLPSMKQLSLELAEELDKRLSSFAAAHSIDVSKAAELLLCRSLNLSCPTTAVFLLGGEGTRFRPITYEIPKALLPIHGKTVPEKEYGTM